jgi:hypothetical protein
MTRYTIEQLNAFRAEAGFSPIANISQRAINTQCREFEAADAASAAVIPWGDRTDYGASDNRA